VIQFRSEVESKFNEIDAQLKKIASNIDEFRPWVVRQEEDADHLSSALSAFGEGFATIVLEARRHYGLPTPSESGTPYSTLASWHTAFEERRSQKGMRLKLPKAAVAELRRWCHEHSTEPFPDQFEQRILALKTCLTTEQILQWFFKVRYDSLARSPGNQGASRRASKYEDESPSLESGEEDEKIVQGGEEEDNE